MVLLAAAAFVLSYAGIRRSRSRPGFQPDLAKLYPVIFDAMLVIAGAAAMALRAEPLRWSRFYAWACLIALLAAVAIGDAVHATGTVLPERASRAAVAITPWVLLLLAFGLLLTMLRHFRKARTAVAARQEARAAAVGGGQPGEADGRRDRADDGDLGHGRRGGHLHRGGGPFPAPPAQVRPGHAAGTQAGPGAGHRGAPRGRCRGHRCRPAR